MLFLVLPDCRGKDRVLQKWAVVRLHKLGNMQFSSINKFLKIHRKVESGRILGDFKLQGLESWEISNTLPKFMGSGDLRKFKILQNSWEMEIWEISTFILEK